MHESESKQIYRDIKIQRENVYKRFLPSERKKQTHMPPHTLHRLRTPDTLALEPCRSSAWERHTRSSSSVIFLFQEMKLSRWNE